VLAAVPAFVLLDTCVALLRGWRSGTGDQVGVLAASALGLALVGALAAWDRSRAFFARRWAQLLLFLLVFVIGWCVAEALVARVRLDLGFFHRGIPRSERIMEPDPRWFPGIEGRSRYSLNSLGIRGPELPPRDAAYRILCVGASATQNAYLDDAETWSRLVMEFLNESGDGRYWVGDVGQSGYATWQHLKFVDTSGLMDEIDAMIVLAGVADFMRALREVPLNINTQAAPLWERSRIVQGIRLALGTLRNRYVRQDVHTETKTGSNLPIRRQVRRDAEITDEMPDLEPALAEYRHNLREMVRVSRERGVRPIFAEHPVLWSQDLSQRSTDLLWFGELADGRYLSVSGLAQGMARFREALFEVCRETGAECIDLSSMRGREEYLWDDAHVNELGAREIARQVAAYLRAHPRGSAPALAP
jgi:lysophospholipase L1-like esterase